MFTTGTKFLIGSTVVAIIAAHRLRHHPGRRHRAPSGSSRPPLALAFLAGVQHLHPRLERAGHRPTSHPSAPPPPQVAPAFSLWPLVFAFGAVTVVVGLVTYQAIVHHRTASCCSPPVPSGWPRPGPNGPRPTACTTPKCAAGSPTRSSSRSPARSPSASSCTRSAGSCCGCRRRTRSLAFGILAAIVLASPSCSPTGPRSSTGRSSASCAIGARRPRRRRRRGRHRRRTRDRTARDHRRGCARGRVRRPEETDADENASQSVAATASVAASDHARRRRHAVDRRQRPAPGR